MAPRARRRLRLRLLRTAVSGERTHRHPRHPPLHGPAGRCPPRRHAAPLVRSFAALALALGLLADGAHVGRPHRLTPARRKRLAARYLAGLLSLLPLLRYRGPGLLQLSVRRHVAGGGLPLPLPRTARPVSRLGRPSSAHTRRHPAPAL